MSVLFCFFRVVIYTNFQFLIKKKCRKNPLVEKDGFSLPHKCVLCVPSQPQKNETKLCKSYYFFGKYATGVALLYPVENKTNFFVNLKI
mmetsp:Transcript_25530/g.29166  ORF Transcript_25530/g.29166 Transcript_25530/m.29166 type:complete len:89 (+) Transcript_25530:1739-2005(+)